MQTTERTIRVGSIDVHAWVGGRGDPLLVLHGAGGNRGFTRSLQQLASRYTVWAPTHPGFGMTQAPPKLTTIDDLAYLYLDLMEEMDLRDCIVVGASLGGWIAAEMAVKTTERISHLVLVDSVGIKAGGRESRDIADIYAVTDRQLAELVYADAKSMARDVKALPESELTLMARSREATGRYAWTPYMHDPKLKGRLHRIRIPTLVLWGAADRVAGPDYGRALAAAIPGAQFEIIEGAGHFPHLEQPDALARRIANFVEGRAP